MKKFSMTIAFEAIFLILLVCPFVAYAQSSGLGNSGFVISQVHFGENAKGVRESKIDFENPSLETKASFDHEYLSKLIFGNVSTTYIKDNLTAEESEALPQRLLIDAGSLTLLEEKNENWRTVKLIQIDLSLSQNKSLVRLSPQKLKSFNNLSFILIKSSVQLTKEEVYMMVEGYEEGDLILLYQGNSNF